MISKREIPKQWIWLIKLINPLRVNDTSIRRVLEAKMAWKMEELEWKKY